jgi:hypothetical protein
LAALPQGGFVIASTAVEEHTWIPTAIVYYVNDLGVQVGARSRRWASAEGLAVSADGGVYVTGTETLGSGSVGTLTLFNAARDTVWSRTYNHAVTCITAPQNGVMYVAAAVGPSPHFHLYVARLDTAGEVLRDTILYQSAVYAGPSRVLSTAEGGCVVLSTIQADTSSPNSVGLLKLSASLEIELQVQFGDTSGEHASSLLATPDGGWILATTTGSGPMGGPDFHLLRITGDRLISDEHWFGTPQRDQVFDLAPASGGGFLLVGETFPDGYHSEMLLVCTDSTGSQAWSRIYPGYWGDNPDLRAIAVHALPDGGHMVCGEIGDFHFYSARRACLYRLSPEGGAGIRVHSALLPVTVEVDVFPNPFNPSTTLSYSLPKAGHVRLAVYDITGRHVKVLKDEFTSAGEHRADFDGSTMPSGIYFARIESGGFVQTAKMVLLK